MTLMCTPPPVPCAARPRCPCGAARRLGQPLGLVGDSLQRRRQLAGLRRLKLFIVRGRQADPSLASAVAELATADVDYS
jgi:hypothetical protein